MNSRFRVMAHLLLNFSWKLTDSIRANCTEVTAIDRARDARIFHFQHKIHPVDDRTRDLLHVIQAGFISAGAVCYCRNIISI
ncbi:hypothetical protein QOZ98_001631 [Planomicrobium stackebrandtii]|uniref:Secreted protein n=1 Tax=Planomicrobium stackebrandtii TaxID=253160 RepID=A0ABU0GTX1_9BACL|nr:hypothetical protein [Planomicrobium stackebrandtii]MDQ0428804.1 hypothetical protein [Planomicrobium stackebrandtii]